jgi:MFS transporter, DHA1 family, multidrug resistance protein
MLVKRFLQAATISLMVAFSRLLRKLDSLQILRSGIILVFSASAALLIAVLFLKQGSIWVMGFLLLLISSFGFVNSNGPVNYLHYFSENSGIATSVMWASLLFVGATAGGLISFFYGGTPIPLAITIFIIAVIAFLASSKIDLPCINSKCSA